MFKLGCTSDKIWNINEFIKFLVINQHKRIGIIVYPEAVDLHALGVYQLLDLFEFESVNIHTHNPFEFNKNYNIIYQKNIWLTNQETVDEKLHTWNLNKKFFCLFGRPTASRLGIAGYLKTYYENYSHIHFSATTDHDNRIQFELDKLLSYRTKSISEAGKLIDQLPLLLESPDLYSFVQKGYVYADPLTNYYQDILVDIIAESHVAGNTFFPTEKTVRPMWLKKPFIIFASKNYLEYLRQQGFRTFSDFWSEDYDGFEGTDRFNKILELIDFLANKSNNELESMYWDMKYTLDHNYNLLKTQTYKTCVERID